MEFYTCIAKYAFFGIRDEKLLATARKSWYHTIVCSGIEVVIMGLIEIVSVAFRGDLANP